MDVGIDTLVYIILGIIFVVAQAAKKKKKQTVLSSPDSRPEAETTSPDPVKGFFEQFLGVDQEEYKSDPEERLPVPDESKPLSSTFFVSDETFSYQKSTIAEELARFNSNELLAEDQKRVTPGTKRFDLRRAVIYSAILERKYF